VLDVQDTLCFKRRIKNRLFYDALIFKNRRQLADYGDRGRVGVVIHHQWDPRYERHRVGESELKPAYLGLERSLPELWQRIPGMAFVDRDYFARATEFNCHLSIRTSRRDLLYKPGTKVSTAAACGAVLVTTADESAVEMLGADYPFYTAPDRSSVEASIERARRELGGPLWQAALGRLEAVRERTAIGAIAEQYLELFRQLD
jgi:hypothetical protein